MADELQPSPNDWSESQVSTWLRSLGVKEPYIEKLYEEEVNGQILLTLDEDFLKTKICMKLGPAHLIIQKRDELINSKKKPQEKRKPNPGKNTEDKQNINQKSFQGHPAQTSERNKEVGVERQTAQEQCVLTSKEDCRPRPFDQDEIDFIYVKHRVLQPESGAFNLTSPCHEFKSFSVASALDRTRLQAKFAKEVIKFAVGCMNIRSSGGPCISHLGLQ
ncbi:sterile alpha motif domain-containing protein 9-like [Eleginops maclovinus]|uniref:sterile alpha motif domain-containing protein 9-like n=1 Tax=Eleginops maclovinus TaxID=56733 RepID=UPI003080E226